jgi:hypothetical protein
VKSIIQFKISEDEDRKPILTKKHIEKVFSIEHIDFIEIAGDDCAVLLIGFRQNQSTTSAIDSSEREKKSEE